MLSRWTNWVSEVEQSCHDEKCGCGRRDRIFVRRAFTPAFGGLQSAETPKSAGFVTTVTAMISNASQSVRC
jgi:hypothetical protein